MSLERRPEQIPSLPEQRDLTSFDWQEDLSAHGQKLYELLFGDVDAAILPEFADKNQLDITATLAELRRWQILDESDPSIIRIKTQP